MGRPRKPTKLKELQGTLHPSRINHNEPVPVGVLGGPPERLEGMEKQAWLEISESIAPGVATSSDNHLVEIVARLIVKTWDGSIKGFEMAALMRGLTELGMSPASRSKVTSSPPKNKNDDLAMFGI